MVAAGCALVALMSVEAAFATVPGENGKIAFTSDRHDPGSDQQEIYVMNPDGSEPTRLTHTPGFDREPGWSPDGRKIAFTSERDGPRGIYVMNADGSGQTALTHPVDTGDSEPAWSPDGTRIAFMRGHGGEGGVDYGWEIWVMNADGSGQMRLTHAAGLDGWPEWSPDGTKIAFSSGRDGEDEIYVMNADGSEQTRLTTTPSRDRYPTWSPDGTRIAFAADARINVMNADGTGRTQLTDAIDVEPTWSPDGSRIMFSSADGGWHLAVMNADGSGRMALPRVPGADEGGPAWGVSPRALSDRDGDGVLDEEDAFPDDPSESRDSDGDGVGDNADAFPDDPSEWSDGDGDGLGDNGDPDTVADAVAALPDSAFRAGGHRTALRSRLDAAEALIAMGDTESARAALEDLRRHLDGCATGGAPDHNDWIRDCAAQNEVRALLDTLLATLA